MQALLAELRRDFVDGLAERCSTLERLVPRLGRHEGRDDFNELFRNVHNLKGAGGTFGLNIVSAICHRLETLLTRAAERDRFDDGFITDAHAYVDLLRDVEAAARQEPADFESVERALATLNDTAAPDDQYALIAETSAVMARVYREVLGDLFLRSTVTDNGLDALARLIREPYAIAILGGELAELNGAAVVAALRASPSPRRGMPVVLVSSRPTVTPADGTTITIARDGRLPQQLHEAIAAFTQHRG